MYWKTGLASPGKADVKAITLPKTRKLGINVYMRTENRF